MFTCFQQHGKNFHFNWTPSKYGIFIIGPYNEACTPLQLVVENPHLKSHCPDPVVGMQQLSVFWHSSTSHGSNSYVPVQCYLNIPWLDCWFHPLNLLTAYLLSHTQLSGILLETLICLGHGHKLIGGSALVSSISGSCTWFCGFLRAFQHTSFQCI